MRREILIITDFGVSASPKSVISREIRIRTPYRKGIGFPVR
jgi:hypothetical protein